MSLCLRSSKHGLRGRTRLKTDDRPFSKFDGICQIFLINSWIYYIYVYSENWKKNISAYVCPFTLDMSLRVL